MSRSVCLEKSFRSISPLCLTQSELCQCLTLSGSSAYRAEGSREDDRGRDRSPLRTDDRRDPPNYIQNDIKKQKLTFGFGKKSTSSEQKKGIQIKLGEASVIYIFNFLLIQGHVRNRLYKYILLLLLLKKLRKLISRFLLQSFKQFGTSP